MENKIKVSELTIEGVVYVPKESTTTYRLFLN
jgi:hypothetical protein